MRKLSRNEWIAAGVAVVFISYMFFGNVVSGVLGLFNGGSMTGNVIGSDNIQNMDNSNTGSGVNTQDVVVGSGAAVQEGMQVSVNYVLKLQDGTVIQDSKLVSNGEPFTFIAGGGQLISGWEMGIIGMKVGGKRVITIPPELGYGAQAVGPIPANSTLIFEIEVVSAGVPTQ